MRFKNVIMISNISMVSILAIHKPTTCGSATSTWSLGSHYPRSL